MVHGDSRAFARFAEVLANGGYEVTQAKTGVECLAIARERRPFVFISGGELPDTRATALWRRLKAEPGLAATLMVLAGEPGQGPEWSQPEDDGPGTVPDDRVTESISAEDLLGRVRLWTRLYEATAALLESEESYQRLIDIVPDGMGVIDAEGRVLEVSRQAAAMLGYNDPQVLVGRAVFELTVPEDHDRIREEIARTFQESLVRRAEYGVLGQNGNRMTWQMSAVPLSNGDGSTQLLLLGRDLTEQKRLQAAFLDSERSLRSVLETALEGVWILDAGGATTYVNKAMAEMLGYSIREMLGRHLFEFMDEADRADAAVRLKAREQGIGGSHDFRFRRKDGTEVWAMLSTTPFHDEQGRYTGVLGMLTDITERKRAAEAVAASERRYRTLVEVSPDAIYLVRSGRISFVNAATVKLFGASSPAQLLGRTSLDFVPPEFHDEIRQVRAAAARGEPLPGAERQIRRLDGQVVDVAASVAPFTDSEGPAVQVILRDITQRKAAEDALRQAHARVTAILESITDGFVAFDREWRYGYVNRAAAEMLRKKPEELLGQNLWRSWPRARERLFGSEFQRAMDESRPVQFEEYYPEPLNLWVESRCYPSPEGLSVFFTDLTRRKEAEAELEELRKKLSRTDRIQLMGELTAALGHELSQPLTAIMSNAQAADRLLSGRKTGIPAIREILQDISKDVVRSVEVIRSVRSLVGGGHATFAEVDLNELVRQTARLIGSRALLNEVVLSLELAPDLPPVLGNRIQLQQVLLNLTSNAFDAMQSRPPLGRTLTIGTSRSSKGFGVVRVRDTGEGIPDAHLKDLFDSFFTTKEAGMGMGLSICRSIIEAHGGRIWAAHNTDCGATFRFLVPLAKKAGI